jgi:uncharacterized membrane protein YccF (DUF307 family)
MKWFSKKKVQLQTTGAVLFILGLIFAGMGVDLSYFTSEVAWIILVFGSIVVPSMFLSIAEENKKG